MAEAQTERRQSRVGKRPVPVPKGVTIKIDGSKVDVQGPKGKLNWDLPESVSVKQEGDELLVSCDAEGSAAPRLQGLSRALLNNMVQGAAEGYTRTLELVGTGYRGELKGKTLTLSLGLSHQVVIDLPDSVSGDIPKDSKGTLIVLTSPDKAVLGQVCASIRSHRPPEPYGGKGVRYKGEHVRRKAGKAGKGGK